MTDLGGAKLLGDTEHSVRMNLAGRVAPVHKTLLSASKVAGKNHDIWLTKNGGWIYPAGSDVGKKIQRLLEEECHEVHQVVRQASGGHRSVAC